MLGRLFVQAVHQENGEQAVRQRRSGVIKALSRRPLPQAERETGQAQFRVDVGGAFMRRRQRQRPFVPNRFRQRSSSSSESEVQAFRAPAARLCRRAASSAFSGPSEELERPIEPGRASSSGPGLGPALRRSVRRPGLGWRRRR